jgi:hypothetical protein
MIDPNSVSIFNLSLQATPATGPTRDALNTMRSLEVWRLKCRAAAPWRVDELARYEPAIRELAKRTTLSNGAITLAAMDLAYRNIGKDQPLIPDEHNAANWAIALWEIIHNDEGKSWNNRQAYLQAEVFVAWVHTVTDFWAEFRDR